MNIKNVVFTLENCDTITIPGKYIGDIFLENLKTEIKRLALNWVGKIELCESFFIEIHNFANTLDYAFSEDSDCFKDDPYHKFDRLCRCHDITQVTINLYDDNDDDKEYTYDYIVSYSDEYPGALGSPNIYQYTYISDLGHLYILIDPKLKLDDVLDYESINDKVAMHFNFELLGIEEDDEEEYSYDKDDNNEDDEDIDKDNQ